MQTVAIKNVKKETWLKFKSESVRHGLKMGEFFEKLVTEHKVKEQSHKDAWNQIFMRKPLLRGKDVGEFRKVLAEFREGFDVRNA
ncbi:hypothetical protein HY489_03525 [Candidatus Woesearchaeota archaeon]|nr:hypothetical protein [Candidatus Woesearchaeota archaeon]